MFKGIAYFIKFSWKSSKFYVVFKILVEIINAFIFISSIVMPKFILDELFVAKRSKYAILYILILLGINLIGGEISNCLKMQSENKKEKVHSDFELYMARRLMICDYENMEKPYFQDLKEKANNYIGGQWNRFGEVMEIMFRILGKILILSNIIYLIFTLNFVVILVFLLLITMNSVVSSYYKKKSSSLQMEEMPGALRRRNYFENMTKDSQFGKEIRINGLETWILSKYKCYMDKFCNTTFKIHKNNLLTRNFVSITNFIQQLVAYGYLVFNVISRNLSIGQFTMYLNAIFSFNGTMNELMDNVMDIVRYTDYYKAFDEYVNFKITTREGKKTLRDLKYDKYEIEFKNVSFKYPGNEKYALKNVSVKLNCGDKVSIVGENGAGKTTFIKLITRLYDVEKGEILLNGVNIKEFDYDEYMKVFSVVFQDFALFSLSIKENIALKESDSVSDEKLLQVCNDSGISKKILNSPKGIYTQVYKFFDKEGIEPSGGEGQKIAIARACIKDAPIVILDEPTAALDPRAEYDIYNNFYKIVRDKTTIYVSHRLSSSRICDRILVFKDGEIIEDGNHNELIEKNGLYAELFNKQAEYYKS